VEAVGPRKLRRLRELALHWLDEQQLYVPHIRFDVVGILLPHSSAPIISYLRGVE
jgi:Holliday junction resolvase-like predicted endonuclease